MRIGVQITGLGKDVTDAVVAHLRRNWGGEDVMIFRDVPAEGDLDVLLLVGGNQPISAGREVLTDVLAMEDGLPPPEAEPSDLVFQIDAKLGRLRGSQLARPRTEPLATGGAKLTRRDLFMGSVKGIRKYSGYPHVFADDCEAGLGCSRCLEACPTNALGIKEGSVSLNEGVCTKCGMCAAVCPVGAVQMPELSDEALLGLLEEIDDSTAARKTLVFTCDRRAVAREPWMVVEQVSSVGMLGPRQVAATAASSLGGIAIVCPDGKCIGADSTRRTVEAMSGALAAGPGSPFIAFLSGDKAQGRLSELHRSSKPRERHGPRSGDRWIDYVSDLTKALSEDSPTSDLGLSDLDVADSCTLCGACAKHCPHQSIRLGEGDLLFRSSTCTGCGRCVAVCPEHSITLFPSSRMMSEVVRSRMAFHDELVACARCGAPIGSAKFVRRVSALLGPDSRLVEYCPECKKKALVAGVFGGIGHD